MRRNLHFYNSVRLLIQDTTKIFVLLFFLLIFGSNKLQASTSVSSITVSGTQSNGLTYGTGLSVTYNVSLACTGNGNGSTALSINWVDGVVPNGIVVSFSEAMPISFNNFTANPYPVTLTISSSLNTHAGNYSFTITASGYPSVTSSKASTFIIDKRALSINANNTSKCVGQTITLAGTEFSYSGLVNSDAISSVSLTSSGSGAAAAPGSYSIVPSAATGTGLGNYTISYTNGTLTVIPANTITAPSVTNFCATNESSDITIVGSDMGSGASYQWQINTNANDLDNTYSYTNISGATLKDYNPGTITATKGYLRKVIGTCSSSSNIVKMNVTPGISGNTITSSTPTNNCGSFYANYINGSSPSGGNSNNFTFQWQSSTDGVNYTNIAGETSQHYYFPGGNATNTIYFRRIVYSGYCTSYSNVLFYNTKAAAISGNLTVTVGSTTQLTGSPSGGTWSSGTTSVATVNSSGLVSGVSGGTSIITYTTTDGCINSATVSVTGAACTNVGITSATAAASLICSNATTTLTANGVVGTNALVTWWSGTGGAGTNYGTGLTLPNASPGLYYARVTGDCGSPVEATVTVASKTNVGILSATAAPSPICSSATTTLTANGVVGTNALVTWWSGTGGSGTNYGTGLALSNASPGNYYARVTGDCGAPVEALVTVVSNPNASIGSVFGASQLCIGETTTYSTNTVVLGGGAGAWSTIDATIATVDASGLVTGIANGSCDIIYTITGGCGGTQTARQSLTVESPGDPAVFGSGLWNVYVYQGNNIGLSGIYYKGYYTESNFSFSTTDRWSVDGSPDEATGYQGCAVTNDNHTFVYKREGFPSGMYQITVGHDDSYQLYIDGTLVSSSGAWDNRNPEVLTNSYTLTGTSRIEFRVAENGGDSRGALTFTEVCTNPTDGGSISGDQSICYNSDPIAFTSSSVASGETGDLEYKWQSSTIGSSSGFSDITPIATGLTYKAPIGLTQTTWYKRLSKVTCSSIWATSGESNVLEITVKPQPTLASITATPTSACTGSNITITVNGLLDGINTIGYDYTNNGSKTSTLVDLTASGGTAITTLNGLAAGNYQVKIKSITVNGCTTNFTTNNTVTWILNDFPVITNPGTQTACDSYTLPTITGTNLSGNQKYYNNSPALGGSVIIGPITSTQTVWIYDTNGTCSDEKSFLVTINPLPATFTVTGGGTYCSAGSVGLSGSQIGVTYHLYENGVSTGLSVSGTGDAISFGNQLAGAYTVVATISNGDCPAQMTGSAVITIGDTEKPAITKCLPGGVADCVKNLPAAITTIQGFIDAGGEVTDNCTAPMTVSYNDVIIPGSPCEVRRTYTITDASTNTATCTQIFTITDTQAPVINSVENLLKSPNDNSCGANLTINQPTDITEACSLVEQGAYYQYTIGGTPYSGHGSFSALFPEGTTVITWTVTDLCGHVSAQKTQTVQVEFNMTAISYDNGSSATGLGSGLNPMQTSTHEYFVDNKRPEDGYTYAWGLYVDNNGVPGAEVDGSTYSLITVNQADVQITFKKNTNSIPEGNYIVSVIKTQMVTTCQKQTTLPITVQSNSSFDVAIDNLGNQCQAPSGNLTTISWNVTFSNVITEPFVFSYSIKLGGTVVASGNVANITYAGAIPMLGLSAGAQTSKSANSRAIVIYYSLYGVSGNDLARTVEIEINATDIFQVSEPNRANNIDDLKINQVPVITFE